MTKLVELLPIFLTSKPNGAFKINSIRIIELIIAGAIIGMINYAAIQDIKSSIQKQEDRFYNHIENHAPKVQ